MQEYTEPLRTTFLGMEEDLRQEFEIRIREYSTLAFRVAYGVLRNREDAEDVTQEAFAKAYRAFARLRGRERFRAWIVKIAWRMALDHERSRLRRTVREGIHAGNKAKAGLPNPAAQASCGVRSMRYRKKCALSSFWPISRSTTHRKSLRCSECRRGR